jgi:hypothetical protein
MAAAPLDKALAFLASTLFLAHLLEALLLQALAAGAIEFSLSVLSTHSFFDRFEEPATVSLPFIRRYLRERAVA